MSTSIAILGDYSDKSEVHRFTDLALSHSGRQLAATLKSTWIATKHIDEAVFESHAGIWIAPGSPYDDMQKVLWAIRMAREQVIPCLGTCGGFQHMVLEYARNVLGTPDAMHGEYDPYASKLFISELKCSLAGREMELTFAPDSHVANIYGGTSAVERYYCNFGVNPECVPELSSGPLEIVGRDSEGEVRVIELPTHPYFIGTLFVPQARSSLKRPHPLVTAFVKAVVDKSAKQPVENGI